MVLRRLLGGDGGSGGAPAGGGGATGETATVRRIAASLEALPLAERRRIAGFAYILGRAANADLSVAPDEVAAIEAAVRTEGGLSEAQAVLVVEIARSQAELYGGTEDFLVTREYARDAPREERERLLRTAFSVAATDGSISSIESAELDAIGRELGFAPPEVNAIRGSFRESLASVQALRAIRPAEGGR